MKKVIAFLIILFGLLCVSEALATDLIWPCESAYTVTCVYYYKDGSKHSTSYGYNQSMDIAGGGNIVAAADGTVVTCLSLTYSYGKHIVIQHPDGSLTLYAHMSELYVSQGEWVSQGQIIGVMGQTGNAAGIHLHFEYDEGDPLKDCLYNKYKGSIVFEQNVYSNNDNKYGADSHIRWIVDEIESNYTKSGSYYYYSGPATSTTVTYNANGGQNAPAPQTKYYGSVMQVTGNTPYRSGYIFDHWNNKPDGTGSENLYANGIWGGDVDITFYAIWRKFSGYDRVLPDGDYIIASACTTNKAELYYLDIYGSERSAANGTKVILHGPVSGTNDLNDYDVWHISYSGGFYTIKQKTSNAVLDVDGASIAPQGKVQAHSSNGTPAQKWAISRNGTNGYRIEAQCSGLSLDADGAVAASGTTVQQYTNNSSSAQRWLFIPYKPSQPIENGKYILVSAVDNSKVLDVPGDTGSVPEQTALQIWSDSAPSKYNSFYVQKLSNGYYKITHAESGKAMEVYGGGSDNTTRVSLLTYNGSIPQQWAIMNDGSGGYTVKVRSSGYAMDLAQAATANGSPVRQNFYNGSKAESWKFVQAEYTVKYDANGGSGAPGNQIKYYKNVLTLSSQKPTKDGYTFQGWGKTKTDTTPSYQPGDPYTEDKDTTLYAIWKKADVEPPQVSGGTLSNISETSCRFTVTVTDNVGMDWVHMIVWTGQWTAGKDATYSAVQLDEDHWYCDIPINLTDGEDWVIDVRAKDKAGNQALNSDGDTCLFAYLWYVTVTFDGNGGTPSEISKEYIYARTNLRNDELIMQPAMKYETLPTASRVGYCFDGWYTEDGTCITINDFIEKARNHTLYAHWTPNQYTVSFDANGGTGAPDPQSKTHGEDLILSETVPDRPFHTFQGWTDGETVYQPGDVFSKNADSVLTAVWQFMITDYTNGKAVISQENGRILVTCNQSCAVIEAKDGETYARLVPIATNNANTYAFEAEGEVSVALSGDVDLNGFIGGIDVILLRKMVGSSNLTSSLDACIADVDMNDELNEADVVLVRRAATGKRLLMWKEETTTQFADYTRGKATIMPCADEVLIKCTTACTVLVKNGDEYARIAAQDYSDDIYLFTIGENTEAVVALKGDVDLNGILNGNDYACISNSDSLSVLQLAVADLNEDDVVNAIEKSLIKRTMLSPADPAYYQLSWGKDSPVYAKNLTLPKALTSIESAAFKGIKAVNIVLPDKVESIADDAFESFVLLVGPRGGYAEEYARNHSLPYMYADEFSME